MSFFLCLVFIMEGFLFVFYVLYKKNNEDKYLLPYRLCSFFFNCRNFFFKSKNSLALCLDSDGEDELKRSVALSQRLCEMTGCEQQQQEDLEKVRNSSFKYCLTKKKIELFKQIPLITSTHQFSV